MCARNIYSTTPLVHSCKVSRDGPGIYAHVLAVSRSTQIVLMSQTLSLKLPHDSICSSKENLVELLEPALDTTLNTKVS